ncbi:hypothetical protein ACU19_09375 [Actinobaculum suis]|nr:hypothetical protein ACU19_09375 [Actinobaculum suis]
MKEERDILRKAALYRGMPGRQKFLEDCARVARSLLHPPWGGCNCLRTLCEDQEYRYFLGRFAGHSAAWWVGKPRQRVTYPPRS